MKKILIILLLSAVMLPTTFYAQEQETLRDLMGKSYIEEVKKNLENLKAPQLYFAIIENDYKKIDENLADINTKLSDGTTPLVFALSIKDEKMAKDLIEKGADPKIKYPGGNNVLSLALAMDLSKEFIQLLLDKGVDVNVANVAGITPLMTVKNPELVPILIKAGIDINKPDKKGNTPLFFAASMSDNAKVVDAFIKNGADVKHTNNKGQTALFGMFNQMFGKMFTPDAEAVKILVKAGTPINAQDDEGNTALHNALTATSFNPKDRLTTIQTLVDLDANLNIKNKAGKTALDLAKSDSIEAKDTVVAILEKAVQQK